MSQHRYNAWQNFFLLVGRICIALIFVIAGLHKIIAFDKVAGVMAKSGMPVPNVFLILAIIFELGGGLLVLFGFFTRFGAFLLFLFLIPVTYVFHSFWTYEGVQMMTQFSQFFKNLAIWGATIYLMALGGGQFSFDGLFCRKSACKKNDA